MDLHIVFIKNIKDIVLIVKDQIYVFIKNKKDIVSHAMAHHYVNHHGVKHLLIENIMDIV